MSTLLIGWEKLELTCSVCYGDDTFHCCLYLNDTYGLYLNVYICHVLDSSFLSILFHSFSLTLVEFSHQSKASRNLFGNDRTGKKWIRNVERYTYTYVPVHVHNHSRRTITTLCSTETGQTRLNFIVASCFTANSLNSCDGPPMTSKNGC